MPTLHWLTRETDIKAAERVPYRLLEAVAELSAGEADAGNMLIEGDNLEALKALLPFYAGQVKCIYIDPPYNTRSAFEHYDDNLEHTRWLAMMWPRLELLRELLSEDGSIWVSIDDNEGHYLKVIMDEVFGRKNFVATVIWKKIHARNNTAQHLSDDHDFHLLYARNLASWKRNKVDRTAVSDAEFWNPDNDPRGPWRRSDLTASKPYSDGHYEVVGPHGDVFKPRGNRYWSLSRETFKTLADDNRLWWGTKGKTFPFRKRFQSELGPDPRAHRQKGPCLRWPPHHLRRAISPHRAHAGARAHHFQADAVRCESEAVDGLRCEALALNLRHSGAARERSERAGPGRNPGHRVAAGRVEIEALRAPQWCGGLGPGLVPHAP